MTLVVLGAAVVALLAMYVKFGPADRIPENERRVVENGISKPDGSSTPAVRTFYVVDPSTPDQRQSVSVQEGADPVKAVVERYAEIVYPDGKVKVLSAYVKDKMVALNFTKGFATEAGSFEEGQIIDGLMKTLGQFENIDKAQIMVDGETLETGHNVYDEVAVIRG